MIDEKLEKAILDVSKNLMEEPVVKEFLAIKKEIENDDELLELDKSIREHQKNMVKFAHDEEFASKERLLYKKEKEKFENHPLILNYNALKDEVNDLLEEIKDIIL